MEVLEPDPNEGAAIGELVVVVVVPDPRDGAAVGEVVEVVLDTDDTDDDVILDVIVVVEVDVEFVVDVAVLEVTVEDVELFAADVVVVVELVVVVVEVTLVDGHAAGIVHVRVALLVMGESCPWNKFLPSATFQESKNRSACVLSTAVSSGRKNRFPELSLLQWPPDLTIGPVG